MSLPRRHLKTKKALKKPSLRLPHLEDDLVTATDAASVFAIGSVGQTEKALKTHDALVLRIATLGEHGHLPLGVVGLAAYSTSVVIVVLANENIREVQRGHQKCVTDLMSLIR